MAEVLTVSELNERVRDLLLSEFNLVEVEGEILQLSKSSAGHYYFILKDEKASISCALFRNRVFYLKNRLQEGLKVRVKGEVSLYAATGRYQLVAQDITEAGPARLYQSFLALKEMLSQRGIFDAAHKKPLPAFIRRVGIVTSPEGAAIRDILKSLAEGMVEDIIIYPTRVQGKDSELEIAAAIDLANERQEVDVLIVARGGGSLEDLWAFNTLKVVEAIYRSTLPTISGVGHETDTTLSDFSADIRMHTPTAAAEFLTPKRKNLKLEVNQLLETLKDRMHRILNEKSQGLDWQRERLSHPKQLLKQTEDDLRYLKLYFQQQLGAQLQFYRQNLYSFYETLRMAEEKLKKYWLWLRDRKVELKFAIVRKKEAAVYQVFLLNSSLTQRRPNLKHWQDELIALNKQLITKQRTRLVESQEALLQGERLLNAYSPESVLARGYSLVEKEDGRLIRNHTDIKAGDKVKIRFAQGGADAMIKKSYFNQ